MKTLLNTQDWKMALCVIAGLFTMAAGISPAADKAEPVAKALITNVRIFDGKSDKLTENMSVLVEGNKMVCLCGHPASVLVRPDLATGRHRTDRIGKRGKATMR